MKGVAKAKVFDIPNSGMNSIDCAREAKAFDVLIYTSEEKEYSDAQALDFEAKNRK